MDDPAEDDPGMATVVRPRLLAMVGVVLLGAYAWLATGTKPFTVAAYAAVAIPALAVTGLFAAAGGLAGRGGVGSRGGVAGPEGDPGRGHDPAGYFRWRSGPLTLAGVLPWVLVVLAGTVLEAVGLALGGRSSAVPTLSTLADHLLAPHGARAALFAAWLGVGWAPVWRFVRHVGARRVR